MGELIRLDDVAEHWWTTEPQLDEWRADFAEAITDLDLAPTMLDEHVLDGGSLNWREANWSSAP